jgi:hypothetical protein
MAWAIAGGDGSTPVTSLADLIRRGQADGDIRAGLDPEPAAWLLLSVLSTRAFRGAVAPDGDRVEDGVTALALRLLSSEG